MPAMQLPLPRFLLAPLLALCALVPVQGAVILTIDITDPRAVLFKATAAHAQNNDIDETYLSEGFTLLGFFNADVDYDMTDFKTPSTLYSPGGNFAYTTLFPTAIDSLNVDLNIAGSGFSTQDFSTSSPAFTGLAVADLRAWMSGITLGTTGNILAGDASYNTVIIGQYQIIPEPGTISLLVGAGLLLAVGLRTRLARGETAAR